MSHGVYIRPPATRILVLTFAGASSSLMQEIANGTFN